MMWRCLFKWHRNVLYYAMLCYNMMYLFVQPFIHSFILNREELACCLCLNPLLPYFLWTASSVTSNNASRIYMILQAVFSLMTIGLYMVPFWGRPFFTTILLHVPFVYAMCWSEWSKGVACSRTLYLVCNVWNKKKLKKSEWEWERERVREGGRVSLRCSWCQEAF